MVLHRHLIGLWKTERMEGVEFLRRFLLHVLPKGFHKVRYYGLWHPAKQQQQANARLLLELAQPVAEGAQVLRLGDLAEEALAMSDMEAHGYAVKCPKCRSVYAFSTSSGAAAPPWSANPLSR